MRKNKFSKFKGFSLIEILLTLFLINVGLGAAVSILFLIIGISGKVENQLTAAYLAQEAIEVVRNIRDSNWIQNLDWTIGLQNSTAGEECNPQNPLFCPFSANGEWESNELFNIRQGDTPWAQDRIYFKNSRYNHDSSGTPTPFSRRIVISFKDDEDGKRYMELTSIVTWQEKDKTKKIEIRDRLYNWRAS